LSEFFAQQGIALKDMVSFAISSLCDDHVASF